MGGRPAPFGMDPADADAAVAALHRRHVPALRLRGIHAHLASGLDAPRPLAVAAPVLDWARTWPHGTAVRARRGQRGRRHGASTTPAPERRFDWAAYGAGLAGSPTRTPG